MDRYTHCGIPFSTCTPNFVKLSSLAVEICPKTKFAKTPHGDRILLPVLRLPPAILVDHVLLCRISARSDNQWTRYGNLTNSTWPPSAILDFLGWHIWTIPHVAGPHYLCKHTKFGEDNLIGGGDMPPKWNSKKCFLTAEFCFHFQC